MYSKGKLQIVRATAGLFWTIALALPVRAADSSVLAIRSSAFVPEAAIAAEYSCTGADQSPPLTWSGVPGGAKSFALIVADSDAPSGKFVHWVIYNLPASARGLPPATAKTETLAAGGVQGINSFRQIGYNGPCPPPGPAHHYHFKLYALDIVLNLKPGANADAVAAAAAGHVLAAAEMVAVFGR
ncbi:MAG TPA: YbhB/YbcL family Raf kinase inhibitor-like protein [Candidatus Binataceae bacterium]|nr:YbhB/YbcL family Raf kinase inhibitor-like protein [Candidatus Binataceae bacterium]